MPAKFIDSGKAAAAPRGGALVKLHHVKDLGGGLEKFEGRMGRVIEMMERSYTADGQEIITVLLDSRTTDYDRSQGAWVAVPLENLKIQ